MSWVLAIAGLAILAVAGDFLVKGAVNLSLRVGIPPLIVGLTIVAFGTSAPELLVSVDAVLDGLPGIAIGNVVGSNTANVLLVLGLPAVLSRLDTRTSATRKSYVLMLGATALFIALAFTGSFGWGAGLVLLATLAGILGDQIRDGIRTRVRPEELEGANPNLAWWKVIAFLLLGLVGLPFGADMLISGATEIAETLGVPDSVIGLTMVAIGTSLPELATTIAAAKKNEADVALGNVIGSNIFNLLFIIGTASLVGEIEVAPSFLRLDLWVMAAAAVAMAPFIFAPIRMTRVVGAAFCAVYAAYLWVVVAG